MMPTPAGSDGLLSQLGQIRAGRSAPSWMPSGSTELLTVPVSAPAGVDVTDAEVDFAFLPGLTEPAGGDWRGGDWAAFGTGYVGQILIGAGNTATPLADGAYRVWIRISGNPETLVRPVGVLRVT